MTNKEIAISLLRLTTTDSVSSKLADQIVLLVVEMLKNERTYIYNPLSNMSDSLSSFLTYLGSGGVN